MTADPKGRAGRVLFASDLHLDDARPAIVAQFERFLDEVAPGADALYLLGDLFEYWVGDDGIELAFNARVATQLRRAAARVTSPGPSVPTSYNQFIPPGDSPATQHP